MFARFVIERPVFAWVAAIVIMLAGVLALRSLPVSQFPDIAPPSVMIMASYPGASATVVETSVTQVLEQELKGLDNLIYFNATSNSSGAAEIVLTFRQGTDPNAAVVQVQNRIGQVSNRLPPVVQQNGIVVSKSQQGNFLMIAAFYDARDRMSDTDIADWLSGSVIDAVSRVPGVGTVRNFGAPHAMRIWLDPQRLVGVGLMPADVTGAIEAQNTEVSAGELGARPTPATQQLNATVTALSRLQTVAQFRDIVVKAQGDGALVRLGDVARVELGSEDYSTTSRLNGHPASGLAIMLAPGANALQTASDVKARLAQLASSFPAGIHMAFPEDSTRFVKLSIDAVLRTLAEAVVLVVLVMFLFLQDWRATLIPAITIPVVLLGTLGVLAVAGFSLNTMTLFAMVLAIGLLVDDAIVVVENVERLMREEGLDARAATARAMAELTSVLVGVGVVLSAVFLPMAFFAGSVGVIYRQFAVTLVAAMALSVLVALTLTPALCAGILKRGTHVPGGPLNRALAAFERAFSRLQGSHARGLAATLRRPLRALCVYGLIAVAMAWLYQRLPTAFVPDEDQGTVMVQFRLPAGASYARTAKVARAIERHFLVTERDNIESVFTLAGFGFDGAGQNAGMAFVALKDWSQRRGAENAVTAIAERATAALGNERDADIFAMGLPPLEGLGETNGLEFWLQDTRGEGAAHLANARETLLRSLRQDARLAQVRANVSDSTAQLRIDIDQAQAAALGLDLADVNSTLGTAWGGRYVNDFVQGGRVKKVFVQGDAPFRAAPEDLAQWFVRGDAGDMTSFAAFARTRWEHGPSQLRRYNGLPAVQVAAAAAPGVSSGDAMRAVEQAADRLPGTTYAWSGLSYQDRLSSGQALWLYAASVLFVFLCLAAFYESWSIPCVVLLVLPLGVVGAVLALNLRGLPNDIYFQVGLLTTLGLSAKNAILIIEFAEAAMRAGAAPLQAVADGARLRLRPIVMTSLAFGAGVVPLVLAGGPGSASQHAIGTGVLGGVVAGTVLVVYFVPLFHLPMLRLRVARRVRQPVLREASP